MATTQPLRHVQGVAAPPVALALAHEAGAERVGAGVAVVGVEEAGATAQVELAGALAVDGKLGAQQNIMGRRPTDTSTGSVKQRLEIIRHN